MLWRLPPLAFALVLWLGCSDPAPTGPVRLPQIDQLGPLRGGDAPRSPRIANYQIAATLDAVRHQVAATATLTWTNSGRQPVDRLPFHLYLNAFKNEATLFMRESHGRLRRAQAAAGGWGWIEVESMVVGGSELVDQFKPPPGGDPDDDTVRELALTTPVEPGATIEVKMRFTAQLPVAFARTGYVGDFHLIGQWFPKIGVRVGDGDDERWECRPFHPHHEFFADFGNYDVTLTVPDRYLIAATGVLAAASDGPPGTRTLTYRARDVHDFVWMADPEMETMSGVARVDDGVVEVRVVYRPEQREFAERHLEAAIGAVERFSASYVPYPWSIMTVVDPPVDAADSTGGMEYPTLVTTAGDTVFARPGIRLPEYITVHEVGHNWFQGILASNEPVEAWLDEGINEWADGKVLAELYGPRANAIDWLGWQADSFAIRRALLERTPPPTPIASPAATFADFDSYGETTYLRTMVALRTLELTVGPSRFAKAMKAYATKFAFKHPTAQDLITTLEHELATDLGWFFGPAFRDIGGARLALRSASCRPNSKPRGVFGEGSARKHVTVADAPPTGSFVCEVVVTNTGPLLLPVDIELRFDDETTERVRWEPARDGSPQHWKRFVVSRAALLEQVVIDPDHKIALDVAVDHDYRLVGNGDASLRGAAWASSLAHTWMQVVGP